MFRFYFHAGHHLEFRPCFVAVIGGVNDIGGGLIGASFVEETEGDGIGE